MSKKIKYLFTIFLLSVLVAACSDEADFSSDAGLRLQFSADTIAFDTIFTETASSTASFLVYNRGGSSLRVSSVALGGGGASPFRVNVDGQYGNDIADVEVRKGDSIFVFVDVNLNRNNSETPFLVCDSLVFTLESGVRQNVQLRACGRDATVLRAPIFESDSTLAAGAYIIYDSLTVASGATLTLPAGCELYFHSKAWMKVDGTLVARGTQKKTVLFRGDRTDNMFDYLPYDRVPGQWGGIHFAAASNGNVLDWCDIHSGSYGVYVEPGDTAQQRLTISNSMLYNFSNNALETVCAHVDVNNSLIANAGGNCVKIVGGNARFIQCTIANFYVWKQRDVALALHNTFDGVAAPLHEAFFANCIITGSKNDEIMGYLSDLGDSIEGGANYRFVSSLLNTMVAYDDENFVNIVWDEKDNHPFAKEHFRLIDNSVYMYDFRIDSLSTARGIADKEFLPLSSVDLSGVGRPAEAIDAGCYQFVPSVE